MALPKLKLKHDAPVAISTGASRQSVKWRAEEPLWSDLLARLSVPLRTSETVREYAGMAKAKRDKIKDVGGFVGGRLRGGRRLAKEMLSRSLITLDLDSIPEGYDIWPTIELNLEWAVCIYSTHSSAPGRDRLRVVLPLKREVTPDEYGAISRRIAWYIGIDMCDDTTYEPSRLMYWASCPIDADYIFKYTDAPWLDPDEILGEYEDWTDVTSWPVSSRKDTLVRRTAEKQEDPTAKKGIVGAFCRIYDIPAAIDRYLPDVYVRGETDDRWTYAAGSTTGGLVLYDGGKFAYSHHGTDPVSGKLVNSFDLVRLHLFGEKDADEPESKAATKLPSFQAMSELAREDPQVTALLVADKANAWFGDEPVEEDVSWYPLLKTNSKNGVASTVENVKIIMLHDQFLRDAFYYDAFRLRPVVCGDLPWMAFRDRVSSSWSDFDDAGLREYLEARYSIESASKIHDGVENALQERIRHPVREYLEGLSWDGTERMETLFIDYLGAEDSPYTRAVTRAAMIGAAARILSPGCKHDHMLVLVGPQGCRKSTTLQKLGKEWFSDSLFTMAGKEAFEQIQGYWIIELGEMAAAKKSEVEQIKSFISKRADSYRAAYAKRTQEHPRQCAFFGSTNDEEFLRDLTGARRFWPVVVDNTGREMVPYLTDEVVDQIWAEAVDAFMDGERWYLSEEVEAEARRIQEAHTETSPKTGKVEEFLEKEIPEDWYERSLEERRWFWSDKTHEGVKLLPRTQVCAAEIWCEAFDGDLKTFTQQQAREINSILSRIPGWSRGGRGRFGPAYGMQRRFVRSKKV